MKAITYWREKRGMTKTALAEAAGISRPALHNVESGKHDPRTATLEKMAAALNVSPFMLRYTEELLRMGAEHDGMVSLDAVLEMHGLPRGSQAEGLKT